MDALFEKKSNIMGVDFDLINYDSAFERIENWRTKSECHYIVFATPYTVMLCDSDTEMRQATEVASMVLPDGIGIILTAKLIGCQHSNRVTGPTMMLKLCDSGRKYGYRHYFYGGAAGVADELAERLSKMYPGLQVVGTYGPPFRTLSEKENKSIVERINSTNPDILWVGLGAPKQEKWMVKHLGHITATAMIGVGAAFDFHSGNFKWAPSWLRKLGLEWLYRTTLEPRRMMPKAKRTLLFTVRVLCFYAKWKLEMWGK